MTEFSYGTISLEQPFGAAMLLAVAGRPLGLFQDPERFDVRPELGVRCYERDLQRLLQ
jgi:hypothetical protein